MYIAIDIGGTKTLIAVFNENGEVIEETKFPTPSDHTTFAIEVQKAADSFKTQDFTSGAIGIRGLINRSAGELITDTILPWKNAPLVRDMSSLFKCTFVIENDSKAAGLSEAAAAGSDFNKVVYITISTGIGTSFVVNGMLDQNTINSEIGKWIFEHENTMKSWEEFAAGSAIVEKHGLRASEIEDPEIWKSVCKNLAPGFINICAAYTPDLIVIGGGVGSNFDKFSPYLNDAIDELKPLTGNAITVCPIRQAARSEEAVIYGCYELAKQAV